MAASDDIVMHRGRLFDHVHLSVKDLEKSRDFYKAIMKVLNVQILQDETTHFSFDELFVAPADGKVSSVHIAFQAPNRKIVDEFYKVAMEHGGKDNGKPGERDYHPGYYAAYVLDADGHNVEAVNHGPMIRSAESVTLKPDMKG